MIRSAIAVFTISVLSIPCFAKTITVNPDGAADTSSISEALDMAEDGDVILLASAIYRGAGNSDLYLHTSKNLSIKGAGGPYACVIDCEQQGHFLYISSQDATVHIEGITVINSSRNSEAALSARYCSLSLSNCIFRYNSGYSAGALRLYNNEAGCIIDRCIFENNKSGDGGGAIYAYRSNALSVTNCLFRGNRAQRRGGAIHGYYLTGASISNCTFVENRTDNQAEGVMALRYGDATDIVNCIFANNRAPAVWTYNYEPAQFPSIQHCLFHANPGVYYDDWGDRAYATAESVNSLPNCDGNITGSPGFVFDQDFHLAPSSAGIDQGKPVSIATDLDRNLRTVDGNGNGVPQVDIGAYEYDPNSPCVAVSGRVLEFIRDHDSPNPEQQFVEFKNCGVGALDWTVQSQASWLQADPHQGTLLFGTGDFPVSVQTNGLERGVYLDTLMLTDPNASNSPVAVTVILRIRGKLSVPQAYASIGEAVSAAMHGEVIEVSPGIYNESVTLNKSLALVGLEEPNIVSNGNAVIYLQADDCRVDGFKVSKGSTGILVGSSGNSIQNTTVTQCSTGIQVSNGTDTRLSSNTIIDNRLAGLDLSHASNITLQNNSIQNSPHNFSVDGSTPDHYRHVIDASNTADGKSIYYLTGVIDTAISHIDDPACVYLVDCSDIVLFNLNLKNNGKAICLVNTDNTTVRRVTISECQAGLWLEDAPNNRLIDNTISQCDQGIMLLRAPDTVMQKNLCNDNQYSFTCDGPDVAHFQQSIDLSNTINDTPIYYMVEQKNVILGANTPASCIYALGCSQLTIKQQDLSQNGYGMVLIACSDSVIDSISATQNEHNGILIRDSKTIAISNARLSENNRGLYLDNCQSVKVSHSWMTHNGTGVYADQSGYTLLNCLIRENTEDGGIRHNDYWQRACTIKNCTIIHNRRGTSSWEEDGGGITGSMSELSVIGSIIWHNQPGQIPDYSWEGYDISYSNVAAELEGEGNINVEPRITGQGHLMLDSPCIDKGFQVRSERNRGVDIDGEKRTAGSNIDMGADEYHDRDLDGLPDWVEIQLDPEALAAEPGGDPDGDGYTNQVEFERYEGAITTPTATYYVDPILGDNSHSGLSPDQAMASISQAIKSTLHGDRLILLPGIYQQDINPMGRGITIQSLDPQNPDTVTATVVQGVVSLISGEDRAFILSGLTLSNPSGYGIHCRNAGATITHCRITQSAMSALYCDNANLYIAYCRINQNRSPMGSIYAINSSLELDHTQICENTEIALGPAMLLVSQSKASLSHCTIANNIARTAVMPPEFVAELGTDIPPSIIMESSELTVTNSIIWDGDLPIMDYGRSNSVHIAYSDISGGLEALDPNWLGSGTFSEDPGFVTLGYEDCNPNAPEGCAWIPGDFHLLSEAGRWDRSLARWIRDAVTSACIDAGDPSMPLGQELPGHPDDPENVWSTNGRVNLGVYGGTTEASLTPK
jgi:parallel beta-helix repeat protein